MIWHTVFLGMVATGSEVQHKAEEESGLVPGDDSNAGMEFAAVG